MKGSSSTEIPSAYVCSVPLFETQSVLTSSFVLAGIGSVNASESKCFFLDTGSYKPLFDLNSSSNFVKINDTLANERRHLYDMLEFNPVGDDYEALAFFEGLRETNEDTQCFGQIMKIFLGAYKKNDFLMIVKTLRFMQNFNYNEIGQVGVSATRMALLDSKNLDVQSAALSLVLCWKSDSLRSVVNAYKSPNDPFINVKMKKINAWCTSGR